VLDEETSGTIVISTYSDHEIISAGGVDSGAVIQNGWQDVYGTAIGATLGFGFQVVHSGGLAVSTTFVGEGHLTIGSGGVGSANMIGATGAELVYGVDEASTVLSGGFLGVEGGGVDSASTVSSGGKEWVEAGGAVDGITLAGGEVEIKSGGTAGSSTIVFSDGGLLKLDDAAAFSGTISGFTSGNDSIDLANINFSGATLSYSGAAPTEVTFGDLASWTSLSGTLTIGDGSHTASLAMLGDYTSGNFHLSDDGHGGTLVTEQDSGLGRAPMGGFGVAFSVDGSSVWGYGMFQFELDGSQLTVSSGQANSATVIPDGARIDVQSGGTVAWSDIGSGGSELVEAGGTLTGGAVLTGGALEIASGGMAGSSIIEFAMNGGVLKLDDATTFGGSIVRADLSTMAIDLVNIAFGAATLGYADSSTSEPEPDPYGPLITQHSGTLTVADGAHVATLAMIGQYTAANFQLADDGHGGTMVTEQPVSSGASLATPH
jgi:autotransporter passenger strand-loop-strand repeat protein